MIRKLLLGLLVGVVFSAVPVFGQVPLYIYDFNGNLNEAGAGPTLTLVGAGATGFGTTNLCAGPVNNTFSWAQGRGLRLDATSAIATYSVEMWMNFTTTSGYRRVLDYTNLANDCGLYVLNGGLTFYCIGASGGFVTQGQYDHVMAVRDGGTNQYSVYVNGCLALTFNDAGGAAIIQAANDLIFFKDNGTEESAGSCASIRFFNSALTALQVYSLYTGFCPPSGSSGPPAVMTYDFSLSTLAEQSMGGPTLTELQNASLQDGFFTIGLPCGTNQVVYEWPINAGLEFNNTLAGNFMGQNHTVEVFMEFDLLTSWKRILDYSNRTQDLGVYAFNGQIQFYNFGTSPSVPFAANVWSHVLLARRKGITPCMDSTYYDMYVDGTLRITLTNTGTSSMLTAANMLHFWQDDLSVGNEASSGTASFIRIYNYALNATQALAAYNDRCDIPLPSNGLVLSGVWGTNGAELNWSEQNASLPSGYTLQRSLNGQDFANVTTMVGGENEYRFVDQSIPSGATEAYYRVLATLPNGEFQASNTLMLVATDAPKPWMVLPNPISMNSNTNDLRLIGVGNGATMKLWDAQGREVGIRSEYQGHEWHLHLGSFVSDGVYLLQVREGNRQENFKVMVR